MGIGFALGCAFALALLAAPGLTAPARAASSGTHPGAAAPARLAAAALDSFYNLDYAGALADYRLLLRARPESAALWNHFSQVELYQEMYRVGALQSQLYGHGNEFFDVKLKTPSAAAVAAFLQANQKAMRLARTAIAARPADAHAHYDLAVAWGLRGTLDFTLRRSYWHALGDAKKARQQAAQAHRLDPGFVDPVLILGVQNYVAGSLPWSVKIFSALAGYHGDKEKGRRQIAYVASHGEGARTDATVLLAVIDRRDGLNRRAAALLEDLTARYPRNVLFAVETAEAEEAAGEHAAARAQYQTVIRRAESRRPGYAAAPLDRVWFGLGKIDRLYSRWPQAARDFEQVLALPRARPQYEQAAALAAGKMEERAGNTAAARRDLERGVAVDAGSDAGKQAAQQLRRLPQSR